MYKLSSTGRLFLAIMGLPQEILALAALESRGIQIPRHFVEEA